MMSLERKNKRKVFSFCFGVFIFLFFNPAFSQDLSLDEIDDYLEDDEKKRSPKKARSNEKIDDISDLAKLEPFGDVAVIQKKYFGKTGRMEVHVGATNVLNDAFFSNIGGVLGVNYHMREKWALEGKFIFLSGSERSVTQSLSERGIVTRALVTPKGFYGIDLKWSPIYGKMSYKEKSIQHFDSYFAIGGGITQTNQEGSSGNAPTIHLGVGQNYAINRWLTFRWDFSWHFYSVSENDLVDAGTFNNFLLTGGLSFYFPGVSYR